MNTNKMESPFRFLTSRVLELHINNTYAELDNSPENCKFLDVSHIISDIIEQEDGWIGIVELTIKVKINDSTDNDGQTYALDMTIEGGFATDKSMSKDDFEKMLHVNGSAALYSIARGFIISTSSQTLVGGQVVLPLLNFTK